MSKTNNVNRNMNSREKNTSNTAKAISSKKKKGIDKVAVGIVVLAVILIGLVGTQLVLNGPSTSSTSSNYEYFNDLNNTFSAKFLEKLNTYRNSNGLTTLSRVPEVSNGSSSTFTLPNLKAVAKENNCNTEDKLADVVLKKFITSTENKEIATASVSKISLDTTVSNDTLNLTVKVPFEK